MPVRFFPGAALASRDPAREFVALRDGAADLAVGSTLFWSVQVVELNLIGLPWLAPEDRDLAALASEGVTERLAAAMERAGVVPLAFAVLGHRELATTGKVLRSPDDMAGMKVRLASTPLLTDLFAGLGAEPRAMALADAQAALRAGTLDAQEGTLATIAAARLDTLGVRQRAALGRGRGVRGVRGEQGGVGRLDRGAARGRARRRAARRRASCPRWCAPRTTRRSSNCASAA